MSSDFNVIPSRRSFMIPDSTRSTPMSPTGKVSGSSSGKPVGKNTPAGVTAQGALKDAPKTAEHPEVRHNAVKEQGIFKRIGNLPQDAVTSAKTLAAKMSGGLTPKSKELFVQMITAEVRARMPNASPDTQQEYQMLKEKAGRDKSIVKLQQSGDSKTIAKLYNKAVDRLTKEERDVTKSQFKELAQKYINAVLNKEDIQTAKKNVNDSFYMKANPTFNRNISTEAKSMCEAEIAAAIKQKLPNSPHKLPLLGQAMHWDIKHAQDEKNHSPQTNFSLRQYKINYNQLNPAEQEAYMKASQAAISKYRPFF